MEHNIDDINELNAGVMHDKAPNSALCDGGPNQVLRNYKKLTRIPYKWVLLGAVILVAVIVSFLFLIFFTNLIHDWNTYL